MLNKMKYWIGALMLSALVFTACDDEPDEAPDLTIEALTATGTDITTGEEITVDLNAATSASDVPPDAVFEITFDREVDAATATASNISVSDGDSEVAVSVSASGKVVTATPNEELVQGTDYTVTVSSAVAAADGGTVTNGSRTFKTAGRSEVVPPQVESQVGYWSFDGTADATDGELNTVFEQISYTADRFGYQNSAALFNGATTPGNGDIVEIESDPSLITPSRTIAVWFKVDAQDYPGSKFMMGMAVERGFFFELGGELNWMKLATNHLLDPDPNGHNYGVNWSDPNGDGQVGGQVLFDYEGSISELVADGDWHQLALTFDASSAIKTIYVDGSKIMELDIDSETDEWFLKDMAINDVGVEDVIDTNLTFGFAGSRANGATGWADYSNAENTYKGLMDDIRIFSVALTGAEIQTLYNAEKP
jgi:hypothetical protein